MRTRRGIGALAVTCALALLGGTATPALAATAPLAEGFTGTTPTQPPVGWSVDNTNIDGMRTDWQGWSFHTPADVVSAWGNSGDRGSFSRAEGMVAVVHSDANRPSQGRFSSVLWAPEVDLQSRDGAVRVSFDSHYKQGQAPQTAQLVARFDDEAPVVVESFARNRLDEQVDVSIPVPAGVDAVTVGWSYAESSNNWFWMIDDVQISEAPPADSTPRVLSAAKPVATAGATVPVKVGGLRPGQQLIATWGDPAVPITGIPVADAAGEASFSVTLPGDLAPGYLALTLGGAGIVSTSLEITVLAAGDPDSATTEPLLWFDGFEKDTWTATGAWTLSTLDSVIEHYGTDRRHAFTRASGRIAVAEATDGAFSGTLTSAPITVEPGDALEVRLDSHYRKRGGAQQGSVTAVFDDGTEAVLRELSDADEESAQLRLPVAVPAGASAMSIRFGFEAPSTAGSWMLDDVQVLRPLAPLADGVEADAVVDIFSDVQGATTRLSQNVLPGFRAMRQTADVLVSNGDLVSTGSTANYTSYLSALAAGGGEEYDTIVSTIGNHEYYGGEGSAVYQKRFLDSTGMREIGGQGGLWGEVLVDGELPLIWIGSEFYDYAAKTGSGPFVDFSQEQFTWLRDRLAHWRAQDKPVLLFSHHLLPYSVSGSYARFYKNDYGQEEARFAALLAQNPNVIMFNGHTHWSPTLNDWSAELRTDPGLTHAPTVVNTAAVTTMYGPSGDWEEKAVGGADPVGLRAALYEDRVRVTAYSFSSTGATEITHVDVARPTTDPTDPTDPVDPLLTLSSKTAAAGDPVTISASGFPADAHVAIELRSTPVRVGAATADADGAFRTVVTIPSTTPAGVHTLAAILPDGTEVTAPLTVTAAGERPGGVGPGSGDGAQTPSTDGGLAATGGEPGWYILGGGLLLVALGGFLLALRRRARG
ncbi:metallophosphoesterase [Microbacterium paraoxydans]|uniref:metallophosphoesterase n=1 Tax=Microbacterium paraoxydans TaxID=199592 RepID=UPI001CFAA18C|nr:metallophosphoesterase [Microbacterium paraoxydans]